MSKDKRSIVEETLSVKRTRKLWTANYLPAIPFTPQNFDIGAVLPVVLYLMRWGHRRGAGAFEKAFGKNNDGKSQVPTIVDVVQGLLAQGSEFMGFDDAGGRLLLADLLLAWCLENKKHALGHEEQVQRVFPTHYLSSWVDLPKSSGHLRGVPELVVLLLADQKKGEWVDSSNRKGLYPVEVGFDDNPLLGLFGRHMTVRGGHLADKGSADFFLEDEADDLGIDELLAVRLAQACGHAPYKAKGKDESERIPNQRPLAIVASRYLREDLAIFIEVYGGAVPRQAFLQMFESGLSLGLTTILLSSTAMLLHFEKTGHLPEQDAQLPWPLFVDASQGQDSELRSLSEANCSEMIRRYERLPVITMLLRLLEDQLNDLEIKNPPQKIPDATSHINLLGDLLYKSHEESDEVHKSLRKDCRRLADALEENEEAPEVVTRLRSQDTSSPVRMAEALVELMGRAIQQSTLLKGLESCLMTDRPNGLAVKRRVRRTDLSGRQASTDLRAIVLTPTMLDFLVHRHLRKAAKGRKEHFLSLRDFLDLLRKRHGLYIDSEPPGFPVSQTLLQRNKVAFERQLRDLGLLVGVNDAESMKQLKARYKTPYPFEEDGHAVT